jgi:hypothetical protein
MNAWRVLHSIYIYCLRLFSRSPGNGAAGGQSAKGESPSCQGQEVAGIIVRRAAQAVARGNRGLRDREPEPSAERQRRGLGAQPASTRSSQEGRSSPGSSVQCRPVSRPSFTKSQVSQRRSLCLGLEPLGSASLRSWASRRRTYRLWNTNHDASSRVAWQVRETRFDFSLSIFLSDELSQWTYPFSALQLP